VVSEAYLGHGGCTICNPGVRFCRIPPNVLRAQQFEATLKIAARLRSTSTSVVAHDDTLMRIAV
jgi:hypothetical protein